MTIGDKVRMLHDDIEGVVIKIIDDKQVLIEDTMGFDFPVLKQDLIVVNPIEDKYFGKGDDVVVAEKKQVINSAVNREKGIYLGIIEESKNYGLYLVNNTSSSCYIACYSVSKSSSYTLLDAKIINSKSKYRASFFPLSTIESWSSIYFVYHSDVSSNKKPDVFNRNIKLKLSKIIQAKNDIPFLDIKGYLKQIDESSKLDISESSLSLSSLENNLNTNNGGSKHNSLLKKPNTEVDLHAEKLGLRDVKDISMILAAQVATFEETMGAAIFYGLKEIIFIHGLGNGTLKKQIHKKMKDYPEVNFFEDAQKSRFGFGATKVVFR